jgi:hypothetical protein
MITISLILLLSILVFPIKISDAKIFIETPDVNNPTEKVLTFKVRAFNKLKFSTIDFKVDIYKKEIKDIKHPYYDLIPEQFHEDDVFSISPRKSKELVFSTKLKTNDKRIINSFYNNVKASYKIVKWKIGDK